MIAETCCLLVVACGGLGVTTSSVNAREEDDVELRLLLLESPSSSDTTVDPEALPGQICVAEQGASLVLELWASDVGSVNTGIVGFYIDLTFDGAMLRADALVHSPLFDTFSEGEIGPEAGRVTNFGGIDGTLTGQGVAPVWARIGHVEMTAIGEGVGDIVSSLGLGGIGVFGRQPPPVSQIRFGTATVGIPYLPGDFDRDCDVDLDDFNQFEYCFTGPDSGPVEPECDPGDFDGDGDVDCHDWVQFVLAWTELPGPPPSSQCAIPAVSEWGMVVLMLLILAAGTLLSGHRRLVWAHP